MTATGAAGEKVRVFVSHASEDVGYLTEFEIHLTPLERSAAIEVWHRGRAPAGALVEREVADRLAAADLVLLLVSPHFMASDDCQNDVSRALERSEGDGGRGVAVVPILLRLTASLVDHPIGKLQGLPKNGKAIAQWPDRDEAWANVVEGLRPLLVGTR
jgi:hypothetical protein